MFVYFNANDDANADVDVEMSMSRFLNDSKNLSQTYNVEHFCIFLSFCLANLGLQNTFTIQKNILNRNRLSSLF